MATTTAVAEDEEEEPACRWCFDGETEESGELISPCDCKGGQKYVHLSCLRRWQRMVLVSQPTHPMFHRADIRQHKCNVCSAVFTCAPPTRHELMASFTGVEITALLEEGCVIGAGSEFSLALEAQLESMGPMMRRASSYDHWGNSAYLITSVDEDKGQQTLEVEDDETLDNLRSVLDDELVLTLHGERLRLASQGGLAGVAREDLTEALAALAAPTEIVFEELDENGELKQRTCGDDHVTAVNLTREHPRGFESGPLASRAVASAIVEITAKRGGAWATRALEVEISHLQGGPCDESQLLRCVVMGAGGSRGWKVVTELSEALYTAARLAATRPTEGLAPGQRIRVHGLLAAPELNGELGMLLRFDQNTSRWLVRVASAVSGRVFAVKPANLELVDLPLNGAGGSILAFWGDARWSRTQLLGEIARGHWGLDRASLAELIVQPSERRAQLEGRLVFAPITSMTEESIARARSEMNSLRDQARAAAAAVADDGNSEAAYIANVLESPPPSPTPPPLDAALPTPPSPTPPPLGDAPAALPTPPAHNDDHC